MEVEWAQKSGLGWRGKLTLLLSGEAGSMFFLTNCIPIRHCRLIIRGQLLRLLYQVKCIDIRPTQEGDGALQGAPGRRFVPGTNTRVGINGHYVGMKRGV